MARRKLFDLYTTLTNKAQSGKGIIDTYVVTQWKTKNKKTKKNPLNKKYSMYLMSTSYVIAQNIWEKIRISLLKRMLEFYRH